MYVYDLYVVFGMLCLKEFDNLRQTVKCVAN